MMTPERLAQRFHQIYEEFAPHFGYETRRDSAVAWEDVPEPNKSLMLAVYEQVLIEMEEEAYPTREVLSCHFIVWSDLDPMRCNFTTVDPAALREHQRTSHP